MDLGSPLCASLPHPSTDSPTPAPSYSPAYPNLVLPLSLQWMICNYIRISMSLSRLKKNIRVFLENLHPLSLRLDMMVVLVFPMPLIGCF